MAGYPRNMTVVAQGSTVTLDIYFYDRSGGILTDPTPTPTYVVKDPTGAVVQATTPGTRVSVGYWTASYAVPVGATISDIWKVEWVAIINGSTVAETWEYFRVVPPGSVFFGNPILISDDWMNQIKKVMGYPFTDELTLTNDQIKELCVFPALRSYFTRFPIKVNDQQQISQNITVPFPDEYTYGVIDLRVVGKDYGMSTGQGASFWDIIKFYQMGGGALVGKGMYGIKGYNPNSLRQQFFNTKQMSSTVQNSFITVDYRVNRSARNIDVWANTIGMLLIGWAKFSNNFEDVSFEQQLNVIKLCQAHLMRHLADTADIGGDSSLDVKISSDSLTSKADKLETAVWELWNAYPFPIYLFKS